MAELIQNYDFEDAIHGNTYEGVVFTLPEGEKFLLDGASIYMQVRKKTGGNLIAEFSTQNNKMEILSDYSFSFKSQVIDLVADTYYYDILIVFADGRCETYIGGKWVIQAVITNK